MNAFSAYGERLLSACESIIDQGRYLELWKTYSFFPPIAECCDITSGIPADLYTTGSVLPGPVNCGRNDVMLLKTGTHGNRVNEKNQHRLALRRGKDSGHQKSLYCGGCHRGGYEVRQR